MNEKLLQFIWQFQYFNRQKLHTTQSESLLIEKPGIWNHHQGPDFFLKRWLELVIQNG